MKTNEKLAKGVRQTFRPEFDSGTSLALSNAAWFVLYETQYLFNFYGRDATLANFTNQGSGGALVVAPIGAPVYGYSQNIVPTVTFPNPGAVDYYVSNPTNIGTITTEISCAMWYRTFDSTLANQIIMMHGGEWVFACNPNRPGFWIWDAVGIASPTSPITFRSTVTDKWHFFGGSWQAGVGCRWYLDSQVATSADTVTLPVMNPGQSFYLGQAAYGELAFCAMAPAVWPDAMFRNLYFMGRDLFQEKAVAMQG